MKAFGPPGPVLALLLVVPSACQAGPLDEWKARLIEQVWWFETEERLPELERKAADLGREVAELDQKKGESQKRISEDAAKLKELEVRIKALQA